MADRFQAFVEQFDTPVCILSVERKATGHRRVIRIVTGNRFYLDTIEKATPGLNDAPKVFVPDQEYTAYVPQDLNFEQACKQAALDKKRVSSYAHPEHFEFWFSMLFLPLHSDDDEELGYCAYIMELSKEFDATTMSAKSSNIANAVLQTCIKLRSTDDFHESMESICRDIRDMCDSEHCCFFLLDTHKRKCSVLCEALSEDTELVSMLNYVNDAFYDIAESWEATLAGSNCLIIRDKDDMEVVRQRNPVWVESITSAGGKNIVLFPMRFKGELLGYIWAINFSEEKTHIIKETLEVTAFILASEIYSNNMMERLHILSSRDMLTGVMNRNEMNNYVDELVEDDSERSVGVIFADLNGLKRINDTEGHTAGDALLKNAAKALREVFHRRSIFRAGGDEFVVILIGLTEDELKCKAEQLREVSEKYAELVFAMGIAFESRVANVQKALHNADERMYEDKERYYKEHPEKKRST
ncbi:GGDEF domain-containing protein [Ruminococcus albus]|uniref:Diguanylate cyclase (GGDEF) domain-containing protein n=1 Tax=Ruminococcus albus TaxID=1264 RepID=A0A1I1LTI3_RUMAL|nr:GGDEF domain-containing protein [Ruminococcus albus]SFC76295.1 diguanylate cyclase (GGDEF) domain-containing protein [Ruminococcus albus]